MRTSITLGTSGTIELFDDIPIPTTYAIADIKKPDTRQGSYTKTIKIPGSKTNDRLFAHIFEIDIDCRFNPNLRTPCVVSIDGIPQLEGHLRLIKIVRNDDNKIEYECSIIGNVSNIFTVMRDHELTALNISQYDHTYNKTVQKASWTAAVGAGYVYPMIDYGYSNGLTYAVENFYPAVYVKTYIDKIFSYTGFTYESNFFNSTTFKSLIIPFNSDALRLSDADVNARLFRATMSTSGTVVLSGTATGSYTNPYTTPIAFDTDSSDPSNQFNTTTYRFTAGNTGSYNFKASFDYQLNSSFSFSPNGFVLLFKESAGVVTTIGSVSFTMFGGISDTLRTATVTANSIDLLAGDKVFLGLQISPAAASTPNLNVSDGSFSNTINNIGLYDGNNVSMNSAIPQKIKMKDLVMSIVKMFNLYIETDKLNSNKLYIEPRNDFYALGVKKDWTDKLAIDRDLELEPMGELDAKKYIYTYTDDKDYYNELYKKTWNETYGTYNKDIDNEFITGNKETKIIFSPTPLVSDGGTDRTISEIYSTDAAGNIKPKISNIRILYYGGVKSTAFPWTYTGALSGTSTETTYPYAGHLNDVLNPTIDLNFGVPREVYYTAIDYTNNHLYNAYYKQFIDEITDKDSKVVTGYFRLNPVDIHTLDFRNEFYVDGHFLRLNKISDYDPVKNELTKCEFLKIKNAQSFVPQLKAINGGAFDSKEVPPNPVLTAKPVNVTIGAMRTPGNFVDPSAKGCIITGARNSVGQGCENIAMFNSSGCTVMAGLHGVTLINTSGVTVTDSDVLYINGVEQGVESTYGKYAPVSTDVANATSVVYQSLWTKVGNIVTVSGKIDVDPTLTATTTQVGISLPIASDFSNDYECSGSAISITSAGMSAGIFADTTNNRAQLQFISGDTTNNSMFFEFTYSIL